LMQRRVIFPIVTYSLSAGFFSVSIRFSFNRI
jgi:hypothetical protein